MSQPKQMEAILRSNPYPGRGILMGLAPDGMTAVLAYFIMGRSENSRNRVFVKAGDGFSIKAFDESLVSDASLIFYRPLIEADEWLVLTNGDQTETIARGFRAGQSFSEALNTRRHEPDAPHFTPRVSGWMDRADGRCELSILRAADAAGEACDRLFFSYAPLPGMGRLIHTYRGDGNPLPPFEGEPVLVSIPEGTRAFAESLWAGLNHDNRVALYVRGLNLKTGQSDVFIHNRHLEGGANHA